MPSSASTRNRRRAEKSMATIATVAMNRTRPTAEKPSDMTPLLAATANGYEALAIFLLDKGADPNAADSNGTALHYALRKGVEQRRADQAHVAGEADQVHVARAEKTKMAR